MKNTEKLEERAAARVREHVANNGVRATARSAGVHTSVVTKALRGDAISPASAEKLRRKTVRRESFDVNKLTSLSLRARRARLSYHGWTLEAIRDARDAQAEGQFRLPAALATAMRFDDAIFVAYHNRIAPVSSLGVTLKSAGGSRGDLVRRRANDGVTVARGVLEGIVGTMVTHGVAFAIVRYRAHADGCYVDAVLEEWPIESVWWDHYEEVYKTTDRDGLIREIRHGDGQWIVFAKHAVSPWQQEACILPSALIFAAHIDAVKDWAAASRSHGQAKIMGMLPEGVPLREGDKDTLSPEADAFLALLQDFVSGDVGAGIKPAGSETQFLANGSTAWQVFSELALNREKAAARVWLGNDGALGSVGGAPGVDISVLFGVATTKVQGDVGAVERALYEGLYSPWCAINYGDSRLAPRLTFDVPDADAQQKNKQKQEADTAFFAAVDAYKKQGFEISQDVVNTLADRYGTPRPSVAAAEARVSSVVLAPTDVAKVVLVSEARAAQGLPPFGDHRDSMTISELDASIKAAADARTAKAEADADASAEIRVSDETTSDDASTSRGGQQPVAQ